MQKPDTLLLVAEDEPLLQYLVRKQLAVLGYTSVDVADNGRAAIQLAKQKRYHIILMDVMMPEMDGLKCTQMIRDIEKDTAHTPIVAMTGLADGPRCVAAGMDDFIQKPVMLGSLQTVLQRWLKEFATDVYPYGLDSEKRKVQESTFVDTDKNLDAIKDRIDDLRKRFGLES